MKKLLMVLGIASILIGCSRETKEDDTSSKEKEKWKLVWEDDFNRDLLLSPRSCFCRDDMPINSLGRSTIENY